MTRLVGPGLRNRVGGAPHICARDFFTSGKTANEFSTGVVYRNPTPHVRAQNAWHPTIVPLSGGRLLATFDLGQAVESLDYWTHASFSSDGVGWSSPASLPKLETSRCATATIRPVRLSDGSLVAVGGRYYRDDPNEGICNRSNTGLVEMDLFLIRSEDEGKNWSDSQVLKPPLEGPCFEIAHSVVEHPDGRWFWPTSTWKSWDGAAPNGMKVVLLVSRDRGKSWPEYIDVFDAYGDGILHFEPSLIVLPDGGLACSAWALEARTGRTLDVVYATSTDGESFSAARSTGLLAETTKMLALPNGQINCFYRSTQHGGLGVATAVFEGGLMRVLEDSRVWGIGPEPSGLVAGPSVADGLSQLRLGYPSPVLMSDGTVYCAFWCKVDDVYEIRWVRSVSGS